MNIRIISTKRPTQIYRKFQITNIKYQTNHNDRNSKFKTFTCFKDPPVLVIGYLNLRFICNLVLVYCFFCIKCEEITIKPKY